MQIVSELAAPSQQSFDVVRMARAVVAARVLSEKHTQSGRNETMHAGVAAFEIFLSRCQVI